LLLLTSKRDSYLRTIQLDSTTLQNRHVIYIIDVSHVSYKSFFMKIWAIIPARGGSKKLPGKNIKPIAGLPMIAWTIKAAHETPAISRVIVSTDDVTVADVARQHGAEVPFLRPAELAQDDTTDWPVFFHALEFFSAQGETLPDIVVHLRPTAPLRRPKHIQDCLDILLSHPEADSIRSVCRVSQQPYKMWVFAEDGLTLRPLMPDSSIERELFNQPRQNLPPVWIQNGSVDIVRTSTILEKKSMSGNIILGYEMRPEDSVNVDSESDFFLAEMLLQQRLKTSTSSFT